MGSFYDTEYEILAMLGLLCSLEFMNLLYILKLFQVAFILDSNKIGPKTKLWEFENGKRHPIWALVPGREADSELITCLYLVTICSSSGSSMS